MDFIRIVKNDIKYDTADWDNQLTTLELINELIKDPEIEYIDQSLHIKASVLGFSEVNKAFKANSDKDINYVKIFSYDTIYLDEDLVMKGINVSIISPKWIVKNAI